MQASTFTIERGQEVLMEEGMKDHFLVIHWRPPIGEGVSQEGGAPSSPKCRKVDNIRTTITTKRQRYAKSGTHLARRQMDTLWDKATLAKSSLSDKSTFKYNQLNPHKVATIACKR